jgi:hypothetical protein
MKKRIVDIKIGKRFRKDLGDIDDLVDSMQTLGLLQPILITAENRLVSGWRRIEAAKRLDWQEIEAYVVDGFEDATEKLLAEADENACRAALTATEAVRLGICLEEIESDFARQRQRDGGRNGGLACGNLPEACGRVRDRVGRLVGMSGRRYSDARAVVEAADEDSATYGHLLAVLNDDGVHSALAMLRRLRARAAIEARIAEEPDVRDNVFTGDFREAGNRIADGCIDLIFTDPPYDEASAPLYGDLAQFASRVLRPGGLCLAYTGNQRLATVIPLLSGHLTYLWQFVVPNKKGKLVHSVSLRNSWRPMLAFYKPPLEKWWSLFTDTSPVFPPEKNLHQWQQPVPEAGWYIKRLCPPRGKVCDPFCCTGTTLVAARKLGFRCVGIEIDADMARIANRRLHETEIGEGFPDEVNDVDGGNEEANEAA